MPLDSSSRLVPLSPVYGTKSRELQDLVAVSLGRQSELRTMELASLPRTPRSREENCWTTSVATLSKADLSRNGLLTMFVTTCTLVHAQHRTSGSGGGGERGGREILNCLWISGGHSQESFLLCLSDVENRSWQLHEVENMLSTSADVKTLSRIRVGYGAVDP